MLMIDRVFWSNRRLRVNPRRFLFLLALLSLFVPGCRLPRVAVKQTVDYAGEFTVGAQKVRSYRARDFLRLDTNARILRFEYLPVTIYALLDERDSVKLYLVSAWQEYLWRFSEHLRPVDKQYYTPVPLAMNAAADTAVITWGYPNIEERDRDLKYVVPRRNTYWSIELFKPGEIGEERYASMIHSYPQNDPYNPLRKVARGGPYERELADSAAVNQQMLVELKRIVANDGADSTRR
jgi:hypothetical protein